MNTNEFDKRNFKQYLLFRKALFLLGLSLFLVTVCAFRMVGNPVILTQMDDGKTVVVPSGNQLLIQLPSNAGSTGYTWNFTLTGDPALSWQKATYLPPEDHPMPGEPGTVVFTFLTKNSGSTQLQFQLQRPWETSVPPAQRFTVTIQVPSQQSTPTPSHFQNSETISGEKRLPHLVSLLSILMHD